jgi:hypothetical protein
MLHTNIFTCYRKAGHALEDAFFVGLQVRASSQVIGSTVAEAGLRGLDGLYLTSVKRGGTTTHAVSPEFVLLKDDILFFAGDLSKVISLAHEFSLRHVTDAFEEDLPALMGIPTALKPQATQFCTVGDDTVTTVRKSAPFMSSSLHDHLDAFPRVQLPHACVELCRSAQLYSTLYIIVRCPYSILCILQHTECCWHGY